MQAISQSTVRSHGLHSNCFVLQSLYLLHSNIYVSFVIRLVTVSSIVLALCVQCRLYIFQYCMYVLHSSYNRMLPVLLCNASTLDRSIDNNTVTSHAQIMGGAVKGWGVPSISPGLH